jgi:hypothetical protein
VVVGLGKENLGGHPLGCALDLLGIVGFLEKLSRKTEVTDFYFSLRREHHIQGLQVSVDL